jgi:hypothetical protein
MEINREADNRTAKLAAVIVACFLLIVLLTVGNIDFAASSTAEEMVFYPMSISQLVTAYGFSGYSVDEIRTAYGLPSSGGAGVTIAVIVAYDTPSVVVDLRQFSIQNNLPLPNSTNFEIHKMAENINSGAANGWSLETCLDIQWAHAIAPDAKILLVESPYANSAYMFAAVQYATSREDVSVVSMSWGSNESMGQTAYDTYFSDPNVAFFAASGDDGSVVMYPSSSPYVVAVGGTTLNLDDNGNVISERAWSKSGGGVSQYTAIPQYQINYGLTTTNRCVPDVAYNADSSTGFSVYYNGAWYIVGGTSAGAPQWAAIYALGASANLSNLYEKAKASYSTYFRDITSGSTYKYSAASGYDYITGLGSPLSCNFVDFFTVTPISGGPATNITFTGVGLTGPTASISYLSPVNSTWISFVNATVTQGNFTVNTNAPDLTQCNPAGDHPQISDNIIFRILDSGNGKTYNATTPFTMYRRGLTQVGNATASAVYGNNTDLTDSVIVQGGANLTFSGVWFSPSNATLLWDNTTIGNLTINQTGAFSASITVPTSTSGQHTLTVQDATTRCSVYVAYMPTLTTDYIDTIMWHTSDFTINIYSDTPVNETYYRINGGATQNVTFHGQPAFYSEGTNNTLEYWCTWSPNDTSLIETTHVNITGITLDKSAPGGSVMTNNLAESQTITLYTSAVDTASGVTSMRFSNDNSHWSDWETYATSKTWTLDGTDGVKTVYAQFQNAAGLVSTSSCTVTLMTPTPTPEPTMQPSVTIEPTPTATATPTVTPSPSPTSTPSPTVPELPLEIVFFSLIGASLMLLFAKRRSHMGEKQTSKQPVT